jgi:pimeloyl-ACP methyl ester carboxylesterase
MRTLRDDNILRLSDGRRLGYAEYGDPEGEPIMLFHGTPGSRLY